MVYPNPHSGGNGEWTLRVVPNKFPALRIEGDLGKAGEGIYDRMNGIGAHEVVIETERHDLDIFDLPEDRVADVLVITSYSIHYTKLYDSRLFWISARHVAMC